MDAADHSLALQPSWLKAYYRKALALEALAKTKTKTPPPPPPPHSTTGTAGAEDTEETEEERAAASAPPTERVVLAVWEAAEQHCEPCALLKKQLLTARVRWLRQFRQAAVRSSQDLLDRYALLTDSREKLSTMAHLWNASSKVNGDWERDSQVGLTA